MADSEDQESPKEFVRYVVKSGERILSIYPNMREIVEIYCNVRIEKEVWVDKGIYAPDTLLSKEVISLQQAQTEVIKEELREEMRNGAFS